MVRNDGDSSEVKEIILISSVTQEWDLIFKDQGIEFNFMIENQLGKR